MRIVEVLQSEFAKQPTKPFYVADAIGVSPTSSRFRTLTGAAVAYGLTTGAYNAAEIGLTDLGRRAIAPTKEGDDLQAQREALLRPRVIREFLTRYDNNPLPTERVACNVLEDDFGVAHDATDRTYGFILDGARGLGLIKGVQGRDWVDLDAAAAAAAEEEPAVAEVRDDVVSDHVDHRQGEGLAEAPTDEVAEAAAGMVTGDLTTNRRVFITHGRNHKIVEQLKELLTFGDFEPIVSVERESVSKPVPDKVLDDMRSCGAAVIHVGTEQRLMDQSGEEQRVINSNVLIEIGAAMMRYGRNFILLVEEGTQLPSNLQGLYEVRYKGDELDYPSTMKLLKAFNEFKSPGR
jgi:predicted nucleotide-binding protein